MKIGKTCVSLHVTSVKFRRSFTIRSFMIINAILRPECKRHETDLVSGLNLHLRDFQLSNSSLNMACGSVNCINHMLLCEKN